MNNIWKRSLSLLLALVMVVGMLPMGALATESDGEDPAADAVQETQEITGEPTDEVPSADEDAPAEDTPEEEPAEEPEQEPAEEPEEEPSEESEEEDPANVPMLLSEGDEEESEPFEGAEVSIWMTESKTSGGNTVAEFEGNPINQYAFSLLSNLSKLVREAAGYGSTNYAVYCDGQDISKLLSTAVWTVLGEIYQDIRDEKTVWFEIKNGSTVIDEVGVAFRDIDAAMVTVKDVTIAAKEAPADLRATVEEKVKTENASISVTHYGTPISEYTVYYVHQDYVWPAEGETNGYDDVVQVKIVDAVDGKATIAGNTGSVTLENLWRVVTFVKGNGAADQVVKVEKDSAMEETIDDPTRGYYNFQGWVSSLDGQTYQTEAVNGAVVTKNMTYTAQWELKNDVNGNEIPDETEFFTVTFRDGYTEGDEGILTQRSVKWGESVPTAPEAAREYYTFDGWDDDPTGDVVKENVVYTATWKAIHDDDGDNIANEEDTHKISFYIDENDAQPWTVTEQLWGAMTKKPQPDPENGSLYFQCWQYKDEDGNLVEIDGNMPLVTGPASYYAKWDTSEVPTVYFYVGDVLEDSRRVKDDGTVVPYPENSFLEDGQKFVGWFAKNEDGSLKEETFVFEGIKASVNLYANYYNDANDNEKIDGSADDPIYRLVLMHEDPVPPLETREELADKDGNLPDFTKGSDALENPVDTDSDDVVFVKWTGPVIEEPAEGSEVYVYTYTYTADYEKDLNNNGKPDTEEIDLLEVYIDGELVTDEATKSGDKYDFSPVGYVMVTGMIHENNTFAFDAASTEIKAIPMDGFYVSNITVDGAKLDYEYNSSNRGAYYNAAEETSVMMLSAERRSVTLAIYFESAYFTHNDTGSVNAGQAEYTVEEIYKAAVKEPYYADAETVTIEKYFARASKSVTVNADAVMELLKQDGIPASMLEAYEGIELPPFELGAVTKTLDEEVTYISAQDAADEFFKAKYEELGAMQLIEMISSDNIGDLYMELWNALNASELHNFGAQAGTEYVNITYTGEHVVISEEEVPVKVVENRPVTAITAPNVTKTFGSYTTADLLKGITVKAADGTVISGAELTLDRDYEGLSVDTYPVTVSYAGSLSTKESVGYQPSEATFTLTVKEASVAIAPPRILLGDDETADSYAYNLVVNPSNAPYAHIIVGFETNGFPVNFAELAKNQTISLEGITVKARIQLPEMYLGLLKQAGVSVSDGFKRLDDVADKLDSWITEMSQMMSTEEVEPVTYVKDAIKTHLYDTVDNLLANFGGRLAVEYDIQVRFDDYDFEDDDDLPTATGIYLTYTDLLDATNYEWTQLNYKDKQRYGYILIDPLPIPNYHGLQLYHGSISNAQNIFEKKYDGEAFELKVAHDGAAIDLGVTYYGITNTSNTFVKMTTAPTEPGVYIATSTYLVTTETTSTYRDTTETKDKVLEGSDCAVILIAMNESNIDISSDVVEYDGKEHAPTIKVTDENGVDVTGKAARTIVTGSVEVDSTTNIGLESLYTNVNIDFPAWLDEKWDAFAEKYSIESEEITIKTVQKFMDETVKAFSNDSYDTMLDTSFATLSPYITKAREGVLNQLKTLKSYVDTIPDVGSITFENNKAFTETGYYLYFGIVTDPDYLPSVDKDLLIIKSADTYVMSDTHVPYDGTEKDITIDDQTSRDGITLITWGNNFNFRVDSDLEAVIKKVVEAAGYTLKDGSDVYVGTVYEKGDKAADKISDELFTEIEERYIAKVEGKIRQVLKGNFEGKTDDLEAAVEKAMDLLKDKLDYVLDALSEKLQEIDKMEDGDLLIINGKLPVEVGEYKFYGYDYDVAKTSATLYIENPVTMTAVADPDTITVGDENPVTTTVMNGETAVEADSELYKAVYTGEYTVTYTKTDDAGNETVVETDLDTALATPGTYIITPVVADGFEVVEDEEGNVIAYTGAIDGERYFVTVESATLKVEDFEIGTILFNKYGWTMSLDSVVYLNHYPILEGFSDNFDFAERGGVVIWTDRENDPTSRYQLEVGKENTMDLVNSWYKNETTGEWYIRTHEIYAKELGDMVWIRPYVTDADGNYVYGDFAAYYSPALFCYDMLNDSKNREDSRAVCAALLEYGASAQTYFDYKTIELVTKIPTSFKNIDLTDYDLEFKASYLNAMPDPDDHLKSVAGTLTGTRFNESGEELIVLDVPTLDLQGAIRLSVGFEIDTSVIDWEKAETAKVMFWTESQIANVDNLAYGTENGAYVCDLVKASGNEDVYLGDFIAKSDHILAKNLGETVYFAVYMKMNDGTEYRSGLIYYSPEAFVSDHLNNGKPAFVDTVCERIAVYGEMARIRFIENK